MSHREIGGEPVAHWTDESEAGVVAVASALPRTRMTPAQLGTRYGVAADSIAALGFDELPVAQFDDEHPSDLARRALQTALNTLGATTDDLALVISTGIARDHPAPWQLSMELVCRLGLKRAVGFDIIQGCAGSLMALAIARDYVTVGAGRPPLAAIVAAERRSNVGPPNISGMTMCGLGDGASVCIVAHKARCRLGTVVSHTEPHLVNTVFVPAGGTREPLTADSVGSLRHVVHWRISSHLEFVDTYVSGYSAVVGKALASLPEGERDVSLVIMNQLEASQHQRVARRLGLTDAQVVRTYPKFGHMAAADIFMGLEAAVRAHRLRRGSFLMSASTMGLYLALPLMALGDDAIAITPEHEPA